MRYGCRAHDFGTHPAEEFAALLQERGYNAAQLAMPKAIAGITDLSWVPAAPAGVRSGLVSDGTRTRRWAGGVEVTAASSPWLTTSPCSG